MRDIAHGAEELQPNLYPVYQTCTGCHKSPDGRNSTFSSMLIAGVSIKGYYTATTTNSRHGRTSYQTFQSQGHAPLPVGHQSSGDGLCGESPQPVYGTTGWPAAICGNMSIKLKYLCLRRTSRGRSRNALLRKARNIFSMDYVNRRNPWQHKLGQSLSAKGMKPAHRRGLGVPPIRVKGLDSPPAASCLGEINNPDGLKGW
ncbi:hypothetical protein M747DRAFT_290886 [Aspergillus niger ATCC 13496]|uniref:Uncharacterized protein n=3 Tax=Aspergillus niger TaxID=5061 RepID=A2QDD0_ASPNC|nr:hypothetical protein An02g06640 [Aspergillus niger]RDH14202.1 hypothetical protein M747DRAFT_290886 [Aspergillus niger ATCC 13496]CAL00662.1 hypothetical protein An02g06640 [Aspergillus niger]